MSNLWRFVLDDFERKRIAAIKELSSSGVEWLKKSPDLYEWFWKNGLKIKPAPYEKIWINTLIAGVFWAVPWGVLMFIFNQFMHHAFGSNLVQNQISFFIGACSVGGLLFGLIMALYAAHDHKRLNLSAWDDLG